MDTREKVLEAAAAGTPQAQIAKALGVSKQRVSQILNPKKEAARAAISEAIARGALERPAVCSRCGAGGTIEAHHPDYDQPLVVVWLCSTCHQKVHQEARPPREPKPRKSRPPKPVPLRTQEQDLAQGFADCEALVVAGLRELAEREDEKAAEMDRAHERAINGAESPLLGEVALQAFINHSGRAACLREMALAVSLGQFRTAECNERAIVAAHREAAGFHSGSRGGHARAAKLSPERRKEIAQLAARARWAAKKGE